MPLLCPPEVPSSVLHPEGWKGPEEPAGMVGAALLQGRAESWECSAWGTVGSGGTSVQPSCTVLLPYPRWVPG